MEQRTTPEEVVITFELVADEQDLDPAFVNAVGLDTIDALQQEGYTVHPVYTGQKGGILVEIVTTTVQLATMAWQNRAGAGEAIADISGLATIFTAVVPTLQKLFYAHEQHASKEESASNPLKITLEIDGASLKVEATDAAQAEAVLKLAQQFRIAHPTVASQVTTKSKVKVQGQVSARKRRRRR
jgi:hypothetical protein